MEMDTAVALMEKWWSEIKCALVKTDDGLVLDIAVTAAIIAFAEEGQTISIDDLAAAISDVLETFVAAQPRTDGTAFIPCEEHDITCLKEFLLKDALAALSPSGKVTKFMTSCLVHCYIPIHVHSRRGCLQKIKHHMRESFSQASLLV